MRLEEVRAIANNLGVTDSNLSNIELVRNIQTSEGNFDCFATAYDGACDQSNCRWRDDCFDASRQEEQA